MAFDCLTRHSELFSSFQKSRNLTGITNVTKTFLFSWRFSTNFLELMLLPRRLGLEWWQQGFDDEGLTFYGGWWTNTNVVNSPTKRRKNGKIQWKFVEISPSVRVCACQHRTVKMEGMTIFVNIFTLDIVECLNETENVKGEETW